MTRMMRTFVVALVIAASFSLIACAKKDSGPTAPSSPGTPTVTPAPTPTPTPTPVPPGPGPREIPPPPGVDPIVWPIACRPGDNRIYRPSSVHFKFDASAGDYVAYFTPALGKIAESRVKTVMDLDSSKSGALFTASGVKGLVDPRTGFEIVALTTSSYSTSGEVVGGKIEFNLNHAPNIITVMKEAVRTLGISANNPHQGLLAATSWDRFELSSEEQILLQWREREDVPLMSTCQQPPSLQVLRLQMVI